MMNAQKKKSFRREKAIKINWIAGWVTREGDLRGSLPSDAWHVSTQPEGETGIITSPKLAIDMEQMKKCVCSENTGFITLFIWKV